MVNIGNVRIAPIADGWQVQTRERDAYGPDCWNVVATYEELAPAIDMFRRIANLIGA